MQMKMFDVAHYPYSQPPMAKNKTGLCSQWEKHGLLSLSTVL